MQSIELNKVNHPILNQICRTPNIREEPYIIVDCTMSNPVLKSGPIIVADNMKSN